MTKFPLMTVGDVAKLAGVAAETVRLWSNLGKLTPMRTGSGIRLFEREQIEEFLKWRKYRALPDSVMTLKEFVTADK